MGCHFLLQCMKVKSEREVAQSCLTLSDPMDCSLPGFSIHGIFQARVLEWVAIAFSTRRAKDLKHPKHPVSCIKPGLATLFIHDILHVSMPFSPSYHITGAQCVYWSAQATITKYHRPGDVNRRLFLTVLEAASLRSDANMVRL